MKFIIDESTENTRIDLFLKNIFKDISRNKIQNLIKNEHCTVNNLSIKSSYILKINDIVHVNETNTEKTLTILPEEIPLDIVWEDENMVVINKPSGMLTHPTTIETSGTLVNALLFKYGKENLSNLNGDLRNGIVHRLDRNTAGLLMVAKNNKTHEFLENEMKNKNFCKKYLAIVKGIIKDNEFNITTPIGRHLSQPHKMAINGKNPKEAITIVKVLEYLKDATLVELTLITGRTHQIRVHLSSIGHPIYNDTLYGFGKIKIATDEQVLQSYKLEFTKPFTEERICVEIPWCDKLKKVHHFLQKT